MEIDPLSAVARVIQLAVAPVFLLTALGTMLGVFSVRLGRIVDRGRNLVDRLAGDAGPRRSEYAAELAHLARRRKIVNLAITAATTAALLVCVLIAAAFTGSILHADFSREVAGLFIAAMIAAIAALLAFLGEVLMAVGSTRLEPLRAPPAPEPPPRT